MVKGISGLTRDKCVPTLLSQHMEMTLYETHPAAEIFPPMNDEEYRGLVEDMREHGQREAIVIFEGKVLDGRHRMRACQELGLEPLIHEWPNGEAPESYVVSVNLHRRHLTTSQRAMIAARVATRNKGDRKSNDQKCSFESAPPTTTEAADMLNVGKSTVVQAKMVLAKGTPEEISAVDVGKASVVPTAEKIREREGKSTRGGRIPILNEMSPEDLYEKVTALERSGTPSTAAARHFGMNDSTCRKICDVVALSRNDDLTNSEKQTAAQSLSVLKDTRQIGTAYEPLKPIIARVWGAGFRKGGADEKSAAKRLEDFEHAFHMVIQTCKHAPMINIPPIKPERLKSAIADLKAAQKNLSTLLKTLESMK